VLTLKAKDFFFDRKTVQRALVPAKRKFLSKVGAFVRRSAQTSMRYRKGPSKPGSPPSAHKERGALLRKLLWFAYDPSNDSVVVGPVATRKAEAPRLNEFGGKRGQTREDGHLSGPPVHGAGTREGRAEAAVLLDEFSQGDT
jgi:hypothetical protein